MTRIHLLQRYYWDRHEMSGLERGVRIIDQQLRSKEAWHQVVKQQINK